MNKALENKYRLIRTFCGGNTYLDEDKITDNLSRFCNALEENFLNKFGVFYNIKKDIEDFPSMMIEIVYQHLPEHKRDKFITWFDEFVTAKVKKYDLVWQKVLKV